MKNFLLVFVLSFMLNEVNAQSNKVVSAWKYLGEYNKEKDFASLQKAKEAIDLATVHEDTKGEAKTWTYRMQVYQTLFEHNLRVNTEKNTDVADPNKKTLLGYQTTGMDELQQTYEASLKVKELDKKNTFIAEATQRQAVCSRHYENKGIACYNAKLYSEALPVFEKAVEINTALGKVDSNNTNNAAIVAEKTGSFDKAVVFYQKLIDMKFGKAATYNSLANLYTQMKNDEAAKATLKKGLEAYPGDINLVIAETNYALKTGENQKAIDNLKIAISKMPTDANLYLVLGNVYDNLANPKTKLEVGMDEAQVIKILGDTKDKGKNTDGRNQGSIVWTYPSHMVFFESGKVLGVKGPMDVELPKPANYSELMTNAETNYKKGIELKPDYFDALYNLGVLYNNSGVAKAKKADTIIDQAKYAKANAEANAEFEKAIPILEKALEVSPTDKSTMYALKQLYSRTNQQEKLKAINEKLKN